MARKNAAQLAMPTAESRTTTLGTLDVPISRIIVREGWNVRKKFDPKEIAALAGSIKRIGQLDAVAVFDATPEERAKYLPEVPEGEQCYTLGQGEQRLRAMLSLERATIRATLFPRTDEDAINAEGNTQRKDLEIWERCEAIYQASLAGVDRKVLAERYKLSPQAVSIYKGVREGLIPEIWEALRKHPTATTKIAMEIYRKSPDEQKAAWAEWLRQKDEQAAANAAGKPKRRKSKGKKGEGPTRPKADEIEAAIDGAVEATAIAKGTDAAYLRGMVYGLRAASGLPFPRGENLPVVIKALIIKAGKAAKAAEVREAAE